MLAISLLFMDFSCYTTPKSFNHRSFHNQNGEKMLLNAKRVVRIVIFGITFQCAALLAFDAPVFYRAPLLQPLATSQTDDWTSSLAVRALYGDTRETFERHEEDKTALFNGHGPFALTRLGVGLEGLSPTNKPVTNMFWGTGGTFADPDALATANANAGLIEVGGRFITTEFDVIFKQNLFWGFYLHVFVPFKELKLDPITVRNTGPAVVNGVDIADFIENTLPTILQENGIKPFGTTFKKSDIGDVIISGGWHKYKEGLEGLISSLGGLMQVGLVIPTAGERDQDRVFALPLGYNKHIGFVARGVGEAGFWDIIKVGAQAGVTIFLPENKNLRMTTDKSKKQNGWIVLEKGFAAVDPGHIWDIGAYVKAEVKGLEALIGYSFVRQERTGLHVKDDRFLKTVVQTALTQDATPEGRGNRFISKDDVANANRLLHGWEMHTVHFAAGYDMAKHLKKSWGPFLRVEYAYPILGKRSWATDVIAGMLGFSVTWNF